MVPNEDHPVAPVKTEIGKGNSEEVDNCHLSKSPKIVFNDDKVRHRRKEQAVMSPVWCWFSLQICG